ncbi:hypothetical protein [Streptomyces sp. NBC_00063]|uniref:hypothetical protein n=1 Tax=Streptomyces sp. NBC_00063 TaxID=2975638 RepID=UPI003D742985
MPCSARRGHPGASYDEPPAPPATEAPALPEGQGPADEQLPRPPMMPRASGPAGQRASEDDLLIVDFAWTVAA